MKSSKEIMEILEACDLTGGYRAAAVLAGCDHKTVAHYLALHDAGLSPDEQSRRVMAVDPFLDKIEERVDRSQGVDPRRRCPRQARRDGLRRLGAHHGELSVEERSRLHVLPAQPVAMAFGLTRRVGWDSTVSVDGVRYSVPHHHNR